MVDNIGMNHGGARPNGDVRKFDDIRDPVRRDSYFGVVGHHKVGQKRGKKLATRVAAKR